MRKVALFILTTLFFSFNAFAETSDVGSVITKGVTKQSNRNSGSAKIVYGGKDISHSIVASANNSSAMKVIILNA